jgi:NAD+ kinase
MNIGIFGLADRIHTATLKKAGFKLLKNKPKIIFVFGGDGSIMKAESKFPGIPKVIVKKSKICKKCQLLSFEEIIELVKKGKYKIDRLEKLKICRKNRCIDGINDIIVHNADPRHAIRYIIEIDKIDFKKEVIGDGIVVATRFGSSGYFRSITDSIFHIGLGLAFNNSTESIDHIVLPDSAEINVKITRGPAEAYADNNPAGFILKEGESVLIKRSKEVFNLVHFGH